MDTAILIRAKSSDNDLLSSFGVDLKETRVTGYLAYLIYNRPNKLLDTLKINDKRIISVRVEHTLQTQRCDIIVETSNYIYIIEAKLFYENPIPQLLKQKKEIRKEFTQKIKLIGITNNKSIKSDNVLIINWKDIYHSLVDYDNQKLKTLNEEFKTHLLNKGLVTMETPELYARDLNHENSISMFLKLHCYTALYERSSKIESCKYFAPHFGKSITKIVPGIHHGISYVSKIYGFEVIKNRKEWERIILTHLKRDKNLVKLKGVRKFLKSVKFKFNKPLIIVLLNKPHLVFNPPIHKNNLQGGAGWLSKRYYSFEDFFISSSK